MTNRVVMGNRSGDYGLWISKPGFDVLTCTDEDMLFAMDRNFFRISQTGIVSIPADSTQLDIFVGTLEFVPLISMNYIAGFGSTAFGNPLAAGFVYNIINNDTLRLEFANPPAEDSAIRYTIYTEPLI